MSKLNKNAINYNPSDGEGWAANYKAGKVHAVEDECEDQYQMLVWRGPFHDVSGCDTETAQDIVDEAVGKGGSLKKQRKRILKGKWLNDKLPTHFMSCFFRGEEIGSGAHLLGCVESGQLELGLPGPRHGRWLQRQEQERFLLHQS